MIGEISILIFPIGISTLKGLSIGSVVLYIKSVNPFLDIGANQESTTLISMRVFITVINKSTILAIKIIFSPLSI
jgi:hypothetical protein